MPIDSVSFQTWTLLPRVSGIYSILHTRTGLRYVGSAQDIHHRAGVHFREVGHQKHHSPFLMRCIQKYGMGEFVFEILELVEVDRLLVAEQRWIDALKPEFNCAPFASSCKGVKHSPATLKKRKEASIKVWQSRDEKERAKWAETSSRRMKQWWANATPEQRRQKSEAARKATLASLASMSPEQKEKRRKAMCESGKKAGQLVAANFTPHRLSALLESQRRWRELYPEAVAEAAARMKATKAKRTPEQKAQALARFRATMAAKKTISA